MQAVQVFYEGRVQGVGFRYAVKRIATGFDVVGWVRNLPDGRVELLAAGEASEIEEFLEGIRESVLAAHIRAEERHAASAPGDLRGFSILA